ncbi:putative adipose-regulatory protein-domain-containing protein [Biscogniauxia mediterranea]|nr:putative adipose-regulatory protein-domain-containing protein [Biscogniauxia mediterranea]
MAPKMHIEPGIMEHVKAPFRAAVSPTARRTYLSTILFVAASLVLLGVAAIAYPVFYYNYVPKKVVSIPVHLQYNAALNPYGVASISPNLMLEQAYDVSVEFSLPRSPANLERGNFMVALYALRSTQPPPNPAMLALPTPAPAPTQEEEPAQNNPFAQLTPDRVVFASRRPALLPYEDPLVSTTSRVMFLLYHALFAPAAAETAALAVPMGELVLAEGPPLATSGGGPLSLLLDVQAGQTLQVYAVTVKLVARLSGVRWAMYNYRVLSFLVCTAVFWASEMLSMALAWLALGYLFAGGRREQQGNNNKQALARREGEGRDLGRARRGDFLDDDDGVAGEAENPMYEEIKREDGDGDDDDDYVKEEEDVKIKKEESEGPESTLVGTPRQAAGPAADEEEAKDDDTWKEIPGPATRTGFDDGRSTGAEGGKGGLLLRKRSSHGAMS